MDNTIMTYISAFIVGGVICAVGQILIDKTKLTSARILVLFVSAGAVLTALGVYQKLVDIGGAGATIPLTGFGYNLVTGHSRKLTNWDSWRVYRRSKSRGSRNCGSDIFWLSYVCCVYT